LSHRLETRIAGIGMSPSNPWIGEMKLSKACIQILQDIRFQEITELIETREPYRVPFYPDMIGVHLLISQPTVVSWNISSKSFTRCSGVIFSVVS
jgi:hypothetical protein